MQGALLSHSFMIVISGTSDYGKPFAHVFDIIAEDKEDARHVAIDAMNDPLGVLREYKNFQLTLMHMFFLINLSLLYN